jgi:hypothetical protein
MRRTIMSDDFEKRLRALEDERDILSTLYAYGHTLDNSEKEEWLDLFTEDGVYHVTIRGNTLPNIGVPQPEGGIKGREALSEFFYKQIRTTDALHKHMLAEPIIRLESDTEASVVSYFSLLEETAEGMAYTQAFGKYIDKMVKGADGKWRFKERLTIIENRNPAPR